MQAAISKRPAFGLKMTRKSQDSFAGCAKRALSAGSSGLLLSLGFWLDVLAVSEWNDNEDERAEGEAESLHVMDGFSLAFFAVRPTSS